MEIRQINVFAEMLFIHNHECRLKGLEYTYRPPCHGGVAEVSRIICIETNIELELKSTKAF